MKTSRSVSLISVTLAVGLGLTGCSLPGTIPLGSPPVLIADESQGQVDRSASIRGSRLCVINNSTLSLSIFWRGYPDAREIPVGERNCNSGYETGKQPDVAADISYRPSREMGEVQSLYVSADNIWFLPANGAAHVSFNGKDRGVCNLFSVGDSKTVETGWLRGAMTRINDSADNVEFEVTLTDNSAEPGGEYCSRY